MAGLAAPMGFAAPAVAAGAGPTVARACAPAAPGYATCLALRRTDLRPMRALAARATPPGYGPAALQSAYKLPSASAGVGQTVAIVDAFDNPRAEADLATYRAQFGLPACTTANGCFRKVNQRGIAGSYPLPDAGWGLEISLDVDMVSAICPNCRILLVEADNNRLTSLGAAVDTAARLGANVISNSYGGSEFRGETRLQSYYNHPGVAITASSGDSGYGAQFPATSRFVTAVGGTALHRANNARGWTESAWSGAGSGCSAYVGKPTWQKGLPCGKRAEADVSAVAAPATGVAVYDSFLSGGWQVVGGTSVSSPIIGSVYALAGNAASVGYGSYPYAHRRALFDVTTGRNGSCPSALCRATVGWDGPTGLGTPNGVGGF